MIQKLKLTCSTFSNYKILAVVFSSITIISLIFIKDAFLTAAILTAYSMFCSWTASNSIKKYLTSRHFKELQHRRLYNKIQSDSEIVLMILICSIVILLFLNHEIFNVTILAVSSISILIGRSKAKTEIAAKPPISEMPEDQYSKRLDSIRSAINDLRSDQSSILLYRDISVLIGSIDYCVNYLPINEFLQQFEFFNYLGIQSITKILKIAKISSIDRVEEDVLEIMIEEARSSNPSIDELLYYLNDTERN